MKIRLILISIIFTIFLIIFINQNVVKYVYISPYVNTSSLKYVTKIVRPIERNLKQVMDKCQVEYKEMKYSFVNYYGSGFVKDNPIPNDLDMSVGVDLGTYEYNGENLEEISKDLVNKIELFHVYTIIVFLNDKHVNYVTNKSEIEKYNEIRKVKPKLLTNTKKKLKKFFENKDSILHFDKKFVGEPIDYTYIIKSNEVLVKDLKLFNATVKGLVYNSKMVDCPREFFISPIFYATIKNTKTNETKTLEFFEEIAWGRKLLLARRFFAPFVFTGNESLEYLENTAYLNDDKKYIESRVLSLFEHLYNAKLCLRIPVNNVKFAKRLHQCTDIMSPALSEEEKIKVYSDVETVLYNKNIQLANEYITALKNMAYITVKPYVYLEAKKYGYVENLIEVMNNSLDNLNKDHPNEVKILRENQKNLLSFIKSVDDKNPNFLEDNVKYFENNFMEKANITISKIVDDNIENSQKLIDDYEIFKNILKKAGLYEIEIYSSDLKNFYIVKDEFTKNLTPADLKQLAKENNLPDVEYKLINKLDENSRGELKTVRYKPTEAQEKYWQELQKKLLEDRKNYKIKRRYIL